MNKMTVHFTNGNTLECSKISFSTNGHNIILDGNIVYPVMEIVKIEPTNYIKVTNIKWDTDGEEVADLPERIIIDGYMSNKEIEDYLSEVFEWCVESFTIEE